MLALLVVIMFLCAVLAIADPTMSFLSRVFPRLDAWIEDLSNNGFSV